MTVSAIPRQAALGPMRTFDPIRVARYEKDS